MALSLQNISLLKNNFTFIDISNEPNYKVSILDYNSSCSQNEEDNSFIKSAIVTFDLMNSVENPIFHLTCTFLAVYSAEKIADYDVLKEYLVIAHLIPYLREYVSNLTSRMPGPSLMLDPINTTQLWDEYDETQKKQNLKKVKNSNNSKKDKTSK